MGIVEILVLQSRPDRYRLQKGHFLIGNDLFIFSVAEQVELIMVGANLQYRIRTWAYHQIAVTPSNSFHCPPIDG